MQILPSGTFDWSDVQPLSAELERAMLDVVLVWASIDGAVSQLYVAARGLEDVEHADDASDQPSHWKLRQVQLIARPHAPAFAARFGKLKKQYEAHSKVRDTIAHCHCAGRMITEPERAVFLRYRCHDDGLMVDAISLTQLKEARRFGTHLKGLALNLVDRLRAG